MLTAIVNMFAAADNIANPIVSSAAAAGIHCNPTLNAPNVWQIPVPPHALQRAQTIFNEALLPHLRDGLIESLDRQLVPCAPLHGSEHGNFFVMRAGSSTNAELTDSSDLAWVSVDDESTFETFRSIFDEMGVAKTMEPYIDFDNQVRLYSSFFVVRSRCSTPNIHSDWPIKVGTNAFTLLTPIDNYLTEDFHLLYEDWEQSRTLKQYRYKAGEALVFCSKFMHSTEPGQAIDGARTPHAFLCFTFGSDRQEHWPAIAPTINGYQSRFLSCYDGSFQLTQLGEYLLQTSPIAKEAENEQVFVSD